MRPFYIGGRLTRVIVLSATGLLAKMVLNGADQLHRAQDVSSDVMLLFKREASGISIVPLVKQPNASQHPCSHRVGTALRARFLS